MPPDSSKHEHAKAATECPEASSPGVAAQPTCPVRNGTNADNADNKHKQLFRKRCRARSIDYDLEHDTCSTTNSSHIPDARASLSPPSGRGLARAGKPTPRSRSQSRFSPRGAVQPPGNITTTGCSTSHRPCGRCCLQSFTSLSDTLRTGGYRAVCKRYDVPR